MTMIDIIPKGLNQWLKSHTKNEKTYKQYKSQINQFLLFAPNINRMQDAELIDIANVFINQNLRNYHRGFALKYFFDFLGKPHLKEQIRINNPPPRKHLVKSLPFIAIKSIVESTDDLSLKLIVMLQYDTACRIGSILGLNAKNIVQDINGDYKIIVIEKRGRQRTVYISKETSIILIEYLKYNSFKNDDCLFVTNNTKNMYYYYWKKLKKKYPEISSHWFRHSRAIHLFERGYNIFEIQRILGHASIESTKKYLEESGLDTKTILIEKEKPAWET